MIQRYSVGNPFGRSDGMIEDEAGEYVLYDDCIKSLESMYARGLKDGKTKKEIAV